MFGCNDNPTARQLESPWKSLLGQNQITASENSNSLNNDSTISNTYNKASFQRIKSMI